MKKEELRFKIEGAEDRDLETLVELYLEGYRGLEEYSYTHPEDVRSYMKWLHRRDPEGLFLSKVGQEIVGFVAGDANWFSKRSRKRVGAVHEIVVLPRYRGMGIGKALMERVFEYFRVKGLDTVELWVGDENKRALEFYKRLGFKEDGRYNYWIRMTRSLRDSRV